MEMCYPKCPGNNGEDFSWQQLIGNLPRWPKCGELVLPEEGIYESYERGSEINRRPIDTSPQKEKR